MDEFKKQAEQARLARMQGIKLREPDVISAPKKNRIEEALGGRKISNEQFSISNQDPIPNLQKKPEPVPEPSSRIEDSVKIGKSKVENSKIRYSRFLARFFLGLGILVLLLAAALGGYAVFHKPAASALTAADTIARVGKLVQLPPGETPTVATVTDLKPLAGEDFFKDAAVGDKVLIYATSSKAILYRPSTDKVIQVSPLNSEAGAPQAQ